MQLLCQGTTGWHTPNKASFGRDLQGNFHVRSVSGEHPKVVLRNVAEEEQ